MCIRDRYEGGIRTPWIVSWPAKFEGGRTLDQPVISLDILPTVVEATGTGRLAKRRFDGKSLLPLLTEKTTEHHPILFWNSGEEKAEWAVREGNWKAHSLRGKLELFDLANDPSEKTNLAAKRPDLAKRLAKRHTNWLSEMRRSATEHGFAKHRQKAAPEKPSAREAKREQKRAERKKARQRTNKNK